jgi:hypothetical protein
MSCGEWGKAGERGGNCVLRREESGSGAGNYRRRARLVTFTSSLD